jgi:YwiC-like protein
MIANPKKSYFRKQVFLPQDHGSWVFIFSPLLIGLFLGGKFTFASLSLVIASLSAFLLRQPLTIAVKAYAGRRPKTDLPIARFWIVVYGSVILMALLGLIRAGFGYVLFLAIPGAPVFAWHLWLVSRREERRQITVEIIATGVLSLTAPAAYWVGSGRYDSIGWWLWILVWAQTAASIVYAYLRLEQRDQTEVSAQNELWKMGMPAFMSTAFNLVSVLALGLLSVLPRFLFLPYLTQWTETLWGIFHPAIKWKPVRIGTRQLIVSILWTILFIITWRL